jgi:hypothetical protein
MEDRIPCPFCGENNVYGSNICGGCFKPIRKVANPEREDLIVTEKKPNPQVGLGGFWRRLRYWLKKRRRRPPV